MGIKEGLFNIGKTIAKKGSELGNIAKLKIEISGLNDKIKKKKLEIADAIIEKEAYTNNDKLVSIVDEINDFKSRIKSLETQIKDIETNG